MNGDRRQRVGSFRVVYQDCRDKNIESGGQKKLVQPCASSIFSSIEYPSVSVYNVLRALVVLLFIFC